MVEPSASTTASSSPTKANRLSGGAIRPWQTQSYKECQDDLIKFGKKRNIPLDRPRRELSETHKAWVIDGEGPWSKDVWYGAKRFFDWLETKSYKMHVRVLLSRYRAYTPCLTCNGARLKTEALLWRLGTRELANEALPPEQRFRPAGVKWSDETLPLTARPDHSRHHAAAAGARLRVLPEAGAAEAARRGDWTSMIGGIRIGPQISQRFGLGYLTLIVSHARCPAAKSSASI